MLALLLPGLAGAQVIQTPVSITPVSLGTAGYTQNFNGLATTGFSSVVPSGFGFVETQVGPYNPANNTYTALTVAPSNNAYRADTYSFGFGASASTDRAFGSLLSYGVVPQFGFAFTNTTGATITKLVVSYTGETYILAGSDNARNTADRLDFQYSTNATSLTTGIYFDVNNLDYVGPVNTIATGYSAGYDGNAAANRTAITGTIAGLSIAPGATFYIRFSDYDVYGGGDGLAVDDFFIVGTADNSCNAAFAYSGSPFCGNGTNPTPTVTGTAGGTFSSSAGLTIDATTGAITLSSSTPGTYTVTYTISSTCNSRQNVTITESAIADFSYESTDNTCTANTSVVSPTLDPGATAGTFSSTTGLTLDATTGDITPSSSTPGTYVVTNTVLPASGNCAAITATATVTIYSTPTATLTAGGPTAFCQGGSVVLTALAGSGNTYEFFNGTTSLGAPSSATTFTTSFSGTYTVVVTNPDGCSATSVPVNVTVNPQSTATFSYFRTAYCRNDINPTPFVTGTRGGVFSSTTGLMINASTGTIFLLASLPGTYTVTYTVAGPCPSSATQSVTISTPATTYFSYSSTANTCTSNTGTVAPTLNSGSVAGTFSSTIGLTLDATTGTITPSTSTPGTYTVTNSIAGCVASTATATVIIYAPPTVTLTAGGPTTFCQGGAVVLTAAADAGNTYQFFRGSGSLGAPSTVNTFTATASGSYAVVVNNGGNCLVTSAPIAVTVNPQSTATFAYGSAAFCANGTNPTPTVTGTAGGAFSSTTGLTIDAATGAIVLSSSTPGTYTVTYAVGGICPSSATQSVTINAAPTATLTAGGPTTFCQGGTVVLTALAGSGNTYQFFNGTTSQGARSAANTFTATASGSYTVVVTSAGNCSVTSAPVAVTVNPQSTATFAYGSAAFCANGANPTPAVTGTAGGTFSSSSGLTLDAATGTITLNSSTPGTYTVTYAVSGPCPSSATQSVTITAPLTAGFSYGSSSFCVSGTANPTVTLAAGASAGTFSSTTGLTLDAATGTITLSSSTSGVYTITNRVAASGGCAAVTARTTIQINAVPVATFSYGPTSVICASSTSPVYVILDSGSTAGTFSSTTGLTLDAATGTITPYSSTPGTYTVTNTAGTSSGCVAVSSSVSVTVIARPSTAFSYPVSVLCKDISGIITPVLGSGATAGTFTAVPRGLTLDAQTGVIDPKTSAAGRYTVTNNLTVTGPCNPGTYLFSTTTITLVSTPGVDLVAVGSPTFCAGGSTLLRVFANTQGTYQFLLNGVAISGATSDAYTATASGDYSVVVTNDSGCSATSAAITVTVLPQSTATFAYSGPAFCQSGVNPTPTVTGTAGGTFASTTGLTIDSGTGAITLSTSRPGTYDVRYRVDGSCPSSATQSVTITAPQTAGFSYGTNGPFCVSGTTSPAPTLAAGATAGTFTSAAGLMLNATTGALTLSSSTPGTYTVTNTLAAANGCAAVTATATVTITAAPMATFSYGPTSTFCSRGTTNPVVALGSGATAGTFSSTAGLTVAAATGEINLSSSTPGTYAVTNTVAAANGCSLATATTSVTILAAPIATFSYPTTGTCAGTTGNMLAILGAGASAGTFTSAQGLALNPATGAVNLGASTAGVYTVTNTVAVGGCDGTATAAFTVYPRPVTPTLSAAYNGPVTTLTSSSVTGNQFYFDGVAIPGATNQTYVINSPSQLGAYNVAVTNASGCVSAPSVTLTVTSSVKPLPGSSLSVYPNPTHDGYIKVELTGYRQTAELSVLNALGQVVFITTIPASSRTATQSINLSGLATGIYLLRVKTEGGLDSRRVIKK